MNAKEEILMKCITQEAGIELLEEIHSGTCGNHIASRTLDGKAFRCREASTPLRQVSVFHEAHTCTST
jgi:hypothetical protein